MWNVIKDFFSYSKSQRNGIIILLWLIIFIIVLNGLLPKCIRKNSVDMLVYEKVINDFYSSQIKTDSDRIDNVYLNNAKPVDVKLFYFNPNQLSIEKWRQLGFSEKQIHTIKSYEQKGGRFFKKEDLRKIYGVADKQYQKVEPFIIIEDRNVPEKKKIKIDLCLVEINSCDTLLLMKLKGIGAVFAKRIIKYRERLGGFYDKKQLLEVYGMDSMKFKLFKENIFVDPMQIKKININKSDYKILTSHPYIKSSLAWWILKHGAFSSIEELKKSTSVNDTLYQKLSPYITIQ